VSIDVAPAGGIAIKGPKYFEIIGIVMMLPTLTLSIKKNQKKYQKASKYKGANFSFYFFCSGNLLTVNMFYRIVFYVFLP